MERALPTLILFLFYVIVRIAANNKHAKNGKKSAPAASQPRTAAGKKADAQEVELWKPRERAEDCEYGSVNHVYSHNSQRRVKQLDGYLAAGLIDRKEYRQMLERYTRLDAQYEGAEH